MSVTSEPSCDVIAASRHVKTSSSTSLSRDDLYRAVVRGVGSVELYRKHLCKSEL